jgi:hypothetical protein
MHDTITTLVALAARQGGTADTPSGRVRFARGLDAPTSGVRLAGGLNAPSGEVRLARGLNAPSGEVRLARGLNTPPPARTASLEGTCTHVVPAPAPVYGHLINALTPQDARHDPDTPGNRTLVLFHRLPGEGHPRHCAALCDEAGVSPVTLRRLPPYD